VHRYSWVYATIKNWGKLFAKRDLLDSYARAVLSDRSHFSKLKGDYARVFVGVLEHKKPGKLIARIEGHIDNCLSYQQA